jgi:hypothetical protein
MNPRSLGSRRREEADPRFEYRGKTPPPHLGGYRRWNFQTDSGEFKKLFLCKKY